MPLFEQQCLKNGMLPSAKRLAHSTAQFAAHELIDTKENEQKDVTQIESI